MKQKTVVEMLADIKVIAETNLLDDFAHKSHFQDEEMYILCEKLVEMGWKKDTHCKKCNRTLNLVEYQDESILMCPNHGEDWK